MDVVLLLRILARWEVVMAGAMIIFLLPLVSFLATGMRRPVPRLPAQRQAKPAQPKTGKA